MILSQKFRVLSLCTIIFGVSSAVALAQSAQRESQCEALKNLKLDHATIVTAQWQETGTVQVSSGVPPKTENIPARRRCEVTAVSRPTSDSEITFTLWMPAPEDWNGKYLQVGNGGWAGTISPEGLIGPLWKGYAVSATDDGHKSANPLEGLTPNWAVGHPEKVIDFGYRALHETASVSKSIAASYYSKPLSRAYFDGCSDGGREALMEAERYPEDFDGIIAGAPANQWTHHFAGFVWNEFALKAKPESLIKAEQLPAIEKAALAACDELDGVKDGLIEDPRKCHFDPSVLLCHGDAAKDCLTQPQIDALNKIYAGPKNPVTGEQIYPGYEPGTEAEDGAWIPWILPIPQFPVTSAQWAFGNGLFAQVVHEDPKWDWHTMDFDRDVRDADQKVGPVLNSYNPDLRSFRDHGGKLIQYHGWGDAAIAPRDSIAFYERVTAFFAHYPDPRSTNPADVQSFYRLFMVPGMGHCAGGPGPTSFGNDAPKPGTPVDAEHDLLLALDRWVTTGVAPDKLIGSGKAGAGGADLTRPLCPYPKVAHYKGTGDTNAADSFECVADKDK
jgi:feruloyl esterase